MKIWLKRLAPLLATAGLVALPGVSLANTRAGGSGTYYAPASATAAGVFPQSSWIIPEEVTRVGLWQWFTLGTGYFGGFTALVSGDQARVVAANRSNGAN